MAECPFSWTQQKEGCWIFAQEVWKPVECRGPACQLWTGEDCVFNVIADRLAHVQNELKERKAG